MLRTSCVALLSLFLATAAHAEKKHGPRVMAMDFAPTPELTPTVLQAMNETLAATLRDQGFEVVTPADIAAALGLERQKQLLGCAESSCLAELGGALGVNYICRGTISVLDQDTLLSLSLIEPKGTEVSHAREHVASRSASELVKALEKLVPQLTAAVAPNKPPAAAPQAANEPAPAAGGLQSSAQASNEVAAAHASSGRKTAGLALMIAGGAVALASAGAGGYALSQHSTWQSQLDDDLSRADVTDADSVKSKASTFAVGASVGGAIGLAAVGAGAYLFFTGDSP